MGCNITKTSDQDLMFGGNNRQDEETYLQNFVAYDDDLKSPTSLCLGIASDESPNKGSEENVIEGRYQLQGEPIAAGTFGRVYKAIDLKENDATKIYAVKVENLKCDYPQLGHEARMYKILEGGEGIPRCFAYEEKNNEAFLVMDMLGESLQKLFVRCGNGFSVRTTLMLADQMISRVQYLHENNYVHRDLKPANFVVGYPGTINRNTVYLLDFGLAKKWRNHITGEMRSNVKRYHGTVGTPLFASRMAHQGIEQARKDDLEGLGYIFFYFVKSLPWMNQKAGMDKDAIIEDIRDKKKNMPLAQYKSHPAVPQEFMEYLEIVRNMKFADNPDYEGLKNLFRNCAKKLNIPFPYDKNFEWDK